MQGMEERRLFFGFSVDAPWPTSYPKGRIIEESARHLTLAFLGNRPFDEKALSDFPKPEFPIGPVGVCDKLLFLPDLKPRVVSNQVHWLTDGEKLGTYQEKVLDWLENLGYTVDRRPFLSHITLARAPFVEKEWEEVFEPLPVMITGIHLYESIGNLRYPSIWDLPLICAFEEFEHTADIAFYVHGQNYRELYLHGALAMSFKFPHFITYLQDSEITDLHAVVRALNQMITKSDQEIGCPFKAVSYHGKLTEEKPLKWEMIVDV